MMVSKHDTIANYNLEMETDQNKKKSFLKICQMLFSKLNEEKIEYCHWKSNEHLPAGLAGKTDLDVLVNPRDQRRFETILLELNFKRIYKKISLAVAGVDNWIGCCLEDERYVHLHVHYSIVTGKEGVKEYHFPWTDAILSQVVEDGDTHVKTICPAQELVLLFLRICIKSTFSREIRSFFNRKKLISKGTQKEIDYLIPRSNEADIDHALDSFQIDGSLRNALKVAITENNLNVRTLRRIKLLAKKGFRDFLSMSRPTLFIMNLKSNYDKRVASLLNKIGVSSCCRFKKKIPSSGGRIIAIIGADGSGKSTNIKKTIKWLNPKLEIRSVYFGTGDGYKGVLSLLVKKIIGGSDSKKKKDKCSEGKNSAEGKKPKKITQSRKLRDYFKALLMVHEAELKCKQLVKARMLRNAGAIVLADRFPQNQCIGINDAPRIRTNLVSSSISRHVMSLAEKEERVFAKNVAMKPDIVIKLDVSPEIAKNRKPDHDIQSITRKVSVIRQLSFPDAIVYSINADENEETVFRAIKKAIWENL